MKAIDKQIKLISLLLSVLILFQSCRVYRHKPVSLDEAVVAQKRVKIKTEEGKTLKFKKVVFEDGKFYGVNKNRGEIEKTILSSGDLDKVRLHNKTMSIVYGIIITYGIAFIIAVATWSFNFNINRL